MIWNDFGHRGNFGWYAFIELTDSLWPESLARDELIALDWLPINVPQADKAYCYCFHTQQLIMGRLPNFEVIAPSATDGFYHYWRNNDDTALSWMGSSEFAKESGRYEAITFIQTNLKNHCDRGKIASSEDRLDFSGEILDSNLNGTVLKPLPME
jgi:hypothetical protein